MGKTQHTPGPWVHAGKFLVRLPEMRSGSGKYAGELIARTRSRNHYNLPESESIANAHLIAAAPDLLEALEAVMGVFENELRMTGMLKETEAVIAKAKGLGEGGE